MNNVKNKKSEDHGYVSDSVYKTLMRFSPICTVDIVFFNDNKTETLLGKRSQKPYKEIFYTFGGRLHKNENPENAAVRIAKKELGIKLKKNKLIFAGVDNEISNGSIVNHTNYHAVVLYYSYILSKKIKIKIDAQHSTYDWFNTSDKKIHKSIKNRIKTAQKSISKNI